MNKVIPITLLTGYLGAGKTTLLNYVLNNQQGYRVAVIVNDIGEVNIDASLIAKGGMVTETDDSLVALQNGCICCNLKEDLMKQIAELAASNKFDYILIEASGICEPVPIVQSIQVLADATKRYGLPTTVKLDNVVSVVDACRLVDEFGSGRELLKEKYEEDDIENLLIEQIEFCTKIVINKCDLVKPEELNEVKSVVKALQPEAEIIEANYGKVDLSKILSTNSFDYEQASMSATWVKELNAKHTEEETEHHHHHHEHHHEEGEEYCCHHHEHDEECHCHDHEHDEECHCHEQGEECHHHDHDHEEGCGHKHRHEHKDGHCCCGHHNGEGHTLEYGIDTFVYVKRKPFNKAKFVEFINNYPKAIIRCKGVVWLSDDEENMYMFEQAGSQKNCVGVGPWVASLPKEEQEQILIENADIREDWKEDVGDRIIKLVIIGKGMDKHQIIEDLNNCLE